MALHPRRPQQCCAPLPYRSKRDLCLVGLICMAVILGCQFDRADRWAIPPSESIPPICQAGQLQCTSKLQRCVATSHTNAWQTEDDCAARGLVCSQELLRCVACLPRTRGCDDNKVVWCGEDGTIVDTLEECNLSGGLACRDGTCQNLCQIAAERRSNVGCEYWAADLDNAFPDPLDNAAEQQYAVVVSNPQPDLPASVIVEQDDSLPGDSPAVRQIAQASIPPMDLRVFKLGPREVDGSPPGEYNTGTGTALTRHAFRIRSQIPVVAYQFNPLDNVGVFSNDASLLKPVEALTYNSGQMQSHYVVVGWPQTIAITGDPETQFGNIDLRAFVAIIGTRPDTHVRFHTTTLVIPGGPVASSPAGSTIEHTLQPFDVLNLETGGFQADFTGSWIESDQPIVVFSGSEASDAPVWDRKVERSCCADHLEEQVDPIRTAGMRFVVPHVPNHARAVIEAGMPISPFQDPEFFRVVAVSSQGPTLVTTSLPAPDDRFVLAARGDFHQIVSNHPSSGRASGDFVLQADHPVILASIQASQVASGIELGIPGGDPSLIIIPPLEQYRAEHVFLTPDKYLFDFLAIAAPTGASVLLDGNSIDLYNCDKSPADGLLPEQRGSDWVSYQIHRCQLSFPVAVPDPLDPVGYRFEIGNQNDGVHRVESDQPVMVFVYGFDNHVSYGYAAGTRLETLSPPD